MSEKNAAAKPVVYLDNSATTRPSDAVVAAMLQVLQQNWHNPSALYAPAMQAEKGMTAARETILKAAGAAGHKLVFTAGGTEADNLAILGYMKTVRRPGRVLLFSAEHPAVLNCQQELERMGHRVQHIPVTRTGVCDLAALEGMLGQ